MKRIICDRCGSEFSNGTPSIYDSVQTVLVNLTNYKITKSDPYTFPFTNTEVDLCPSCMTKFRDWMNNNSTLTSKEKR